MRALFLFVALLFAGCSEPEPQVVKRQRLDAPAEAGSTGCDMDWRRCEPGQRRWND